LHRLTVDTLRIRVCVLMTGTLLLGGVAGALLFGVLQERTLLIPAVLTGLCGVTCGLYCQHTISSGGRSGSD
jgi:uncharacterized membrane protein YsdA (DUF1294 family)